MATVTTPAGEVLEGVTGTLLDYYRGEGYDITEDEASPEAQFPVIYEDGQIVELPEPMVAVEHPADGTMSPPVGDGSEGQQVVQLPEGQYVDDAGVVRYTETQEPVEPTGKSRRS